MKNSNSLFSKNSVNRPQLFDFIVFVSIVDLPLCDKIVMPVSEWIFMLVLIAGRVKSSEPEIEGNKECLF